MASTLITVAPTGAETAKADCPALPTTLDELVETAKRCEAAGAAMIHIHIRDGEHKPTLDLGRLTETVAAVRENTALIVQLSTGSAVTNPYDHRLRVLDAVHGLTLAPLTDADLCCGSAGIYNLVEPDTSDAVLAPKLRHIVDTRADLVATGNPGCLMQIGAGLRAAGLPIRCAALTAPGSYDTHDNQADDFNQGLSQTCDAVFAFQRDLEARGLQRTDGGLPAGAGALDEHVDLAHAVLHGPARSGLGGQLGGERSRLAGALEAHLARGGPGDDRTGRVGDRHDGVVEGALDVRLPVGDVLAFLAPDLLDGGPSACLRWHKSVRSYYFRPGFFLPATVRFGPLRVRALVRVL